MLKIPRTIFTRPLDQELGFGKNVTTVGRMMNPDGTFNVERQYLNWWDNTYFHLVTMSWKYFFLLVFISYLVINLLFALLYMVAGMDQFSGLQEQDFWSNLSFAFYFSTQTLTTVGYGYISPTGHLASTLASLESFVGLLAFALISGLLYGRFSRPTAKIVFSDNMLVSPYREGMGLMFRMGNARKSELIETEVEMILAMNQQEAEGATIRKFYGLKLEIAKISFFSLSWTVVHDLSKESPLWGLTKADLEDANAEVLVLVKGTDEANQQIVHARRSYVAEEMVWNARFSPIISRKSNGVPHVLMRQIGAFRLLEQV
ncbi:MAG: hypothetical protein EP344_08925 [Bacteroidetes bacterium]|nr:MAG: hypothetical protein EP344_08925 [Bacteroidota bacterium]